MQQQCAKEKSTKFGHGKGSGIAGNPECVGLGHVGVFYSVLASAWVVVVSVSAFSLY